MYLAPLLCGLGILLAVPNTPALPFDDSSNRQLTIAYSLEEEGKPLVDFAVRHLAFHGSEGYDYSKILKPDLPPGWEHTFSNNILFEDGQVIDNDLKNKSWAKYRCDKGTFLGWLNYVYSGAGIAAGLAQYAVQNPAKFTVSEKNGATVFALTAEGAKASGMPGLEKVMNSISVDKNPPMFLREMVLPDDAGPVKAVVRLSFSFGVAGPAESDLFKPSMVPKEIPNPLPSREQYP